MKHWISQSIFFLIALCSLNRGFALYFGNPAEPAAIQEALVIPEDAFVFVKVGYETDLIFDKRLKCYDGASGRVDLFKTLMNQGVITLDFLDRFEVYGSVGATQSYFTHRPNSAHLMREYQTNSSTTWGVGGRVLLFEFKDFSVGMGGSYQWANPHVKWDALSGDAFTTDARMKYREWQVGLGCAYQVEMFIPYLAVKFSDVSAKVSSLRPNLNLNHSSFRMRNRDRFGLVLGVTLAATRGFDMTIESRLIDEEALSIVLNMEF
jgi:hypothetical protein